MYGNEKYDNRVFNFYLTTHSATTQHLLTSTTLRALKDLGNSNEQIDEGKVEIPIE